ncbi:MAG TPA: hypothetical protein VG961_10705 [Ignavibacteria bacterium]|nr:hypothetical protein [Ignavibacteria bacterium]
MDIREEALKEHSKTQTMKIAAWIGNSDSRYRQYLKHFLHDEYRVVQRISWVLSVVAESHPKLVEKNISTIINRLDDEDIHVAVKRNVVRVLQFLKIPPKYYAKVFDHCIKFITDPNETVAVRCFAMTVAARIAEKYPELKNELSETINVSLKTLTPGLRSRSKTVLAQLK